MKTKTVDEILAGDDGLMLGLIYAEGMRVHVRARRHPYHVILEPTNDITAVLEVLQHHPDANVIPETGMPGLMMPLWFQRAYFRSDDAAMKVLMRIRPNLELKVAHNLALGHRVIPCYPSDNLIIPALGKCCCKEGLTRPHQYGHAVWPLSCPTDNFSCVVPVLYAVPGIGWKRVTDDGKLLPLLPSPVWVSELKNSVVHLFVKGQL